MLVAVDRPEPRRIVHSLENTEWYDLRCGLDSCLVLTHTTHPDDVERLTTDHRPASCQPDEAIETSTFAIETSTFVLETSTFALNAVWHWDSH